MDASSTFKLYQIRDVCNGEIDEDDDSFFDLILESSSCCAIKKDFEFMDSPMNDFPKPISPVTPLRSTPRLKVFTLGFTKRSKSAKIESHSEFKLRPFLKSSRDSSKCSKPEDLPVPSVFLDNSLRSQMLKDSPDFYDVEKKSVSKYLKLIRPFYTKASKNVKVTVLSSTPSCSPAVNLSQRKFSEEGRINSFKIVARKLVRSRSTSAAVGMPPIQRRRDDMLMEQQDGIQAAILHCKKSYFSSCDEQKRFSI